ncbi:MAG: hypothetical protein JWL61_3201 [Gemmatimonadetes bacterium]|nr:hypothetical protein [Gemmatimonadota bacterium]
MAKSGLTRLDVNAAACAPATTPVRAGLLQRKCACGGSTGLTGECEECREKRLTVQRRRAGRAEPDTMSPDVTDVLHSRGQPLDPTTRAFMERRFQHDFSLVRVHTGAAAAESARAVNALAYTVGNHIVFDARQFAPATRDGRRLLAHELTHTVQQQGAPTPVGRLHLSDPRDHFESEADRAAEAVAADKPVSVTAGAATVLARQPSGPTPETPEELEEKKRLEREFARARSVERGRIPEGVQNTWGWGGRETANIYQECSIAPMDRTTFRSFLRTLPARLRRNKPKDADDVMGVTHFDPNRTVPPTIEAVPVREGQKTVYKLKPTHAEMPPILSAFTKIEKEPKEFVEGTAAFAKDDCTDLWKSLQRPVKRRYDIIWQLPDDGAEQFRKAEEEHCQDIRLAFDLTMGRYASAINNLAAAERTYGSEKQVVDEATRRVGVHPDQMLQEFYNAAIKTETRDTNGWHTAKCATKTHCQDPNPALNGCRGYVRRVDAAALPDVGVHPPEEVVTL